ncbi:MAG: malate dehydrogenase [Armatimonadota bacterium]|nr:malate dehydrogenase [Armatimonadota bacterium]MDR7439921.1 malate dehydrogenase [Armatimonadota bacterium]MDR7562508.1 malate dehydrogenase [Armatimonadota bacterium]MDR7566793.1 malate dehydrogenase [Armatimonadota bacterium]MDR7601392.1 malate dehydrogenase [Armatimonadota bacterium]
MARGRPKISVVGAGAVGTAAAQWMAARELGDIVLVDIIEGLPQGRALDLQHAGPIAGFDVGITGSNDYAATAGSDVVVVTAGVPRKPGMTREQLVDTNAGIVRSIMQEVVPRSPEAVYVIVTNPLDAMTYIAYRASGLPRVRVIGQSGALDTTRFRAFLAAELGVSIQDVQALVIGAHTDKDMVPVASLANVRGIPVTRLLPRERLETVVARTRRAGAEITELMKQSAFTAPGAAICEMVEAILRDRKRLIPCSVYLEGEYGERDVCVGVPVILGAGGVERIVELPLSEEEWAMFRASCAAVRELVGAVQV